MNHFSTWTIFLDYLMAQVGEPYRYGGDDPVLGFDCSGLAQEALMAFGAMPRQPKMRAQTIFTLFKPVIVRPEETTRMGDLIFFGRGPQDISHVGIAITEYLMIHAGGGTSDTLSLQVASDRNAFVRIDAIDYRKDRVAIVRPYYPAMFLDP